MNQNPVATRETGETRRVQYGQPRASIDEASNEYLLELEMPGVTKEGLTVHVENNELVVVGERSPHDLPGEVIHREIRPQSYKRVFELDPAIDSSKISARLEHGVVRIALPKAAEGRPRRIEVTG